MTAVVRAGQVIVAAQRLARLAKQILADFVAVANIAVIAVGIAGAALVDHQFEVEGEGFEAEEPPEEEGDVAAVEAAAVEMEVTVETVTAFEPEPEPEPGADMADEAAGETEEQPEQG